MEYFALFFEALYELSNAMAIYIIAGLFFAGMMHEMLPQRMVESYLGRNDTAAVIKATLLGIPLPVCSCSVIPLAASIKKSGASNGATLSFLISAPITGADSILATFGMFGWAFTFYRLLSSVLIALAAGMFSNVTELKRQQYAWQSTPPLKAATEEPCCTDGTCKEDKAGEGFSFRLAMGYGFGTLMGDMAKPLFWGMLLGALITVLIPEDLSELLQAHMALSYLFCVAIAVPMYVCATSSLPIAASLMLSGVSTGAAFVFLTAGPATNTVTIGVVRQMLGRRALAIYLSTIILGSVLFGLGLDLLFGYFAVDMMTMVHVLEEATMIDMAASLILWGLIIYFLFKPLLVKKEACNAASCCGD